MQERKVGILLSYINIVLHTVIGFAYVPILLHYIGKSEYGLYQLIGSLIAYFSVMDFGLTNALIRYYTKYKALGDKKAMANILAIAVRIYGVIAVLLLVAGTCCYFYLPAIFANSMDVSEISAAQSLFLLLLFNVIVSVSTLLFRAVINAHERFLFLKGLELIQLVLQPIMVILILQVNRSAFSVALVQTFLNIALITSRIYYCYAKLDIEIKYSGAEHRLINGLKHLALSLFLVALIDQVFFKTNQFVLGICIGTEAVAVYSIAAVIYMNYMALSCAISGVYLPHVTELVSRKVKTDELSRLFIRIGRWQFYLLSLVLTGFIIFGKEFISLWAGEDFQEAYLITLLIIIPFTVDLIQNVGLSILQAMNMYMFRAKVFMVVGVLNLALAFPLAKIYGGQGCAFATGLALLIANGFVMNWYYAKVIKLNIKNFWMSIGKIALPITGVMIVGLFVEREFLNLRGWLDLTSGIVVYSFVFITVLFMFCLNSEEREEIKRLLKR